MMLPPPCASIFRPTAWQHMNVPFRLSVTTLSQTSSGKSSARCREAVPALLTRTSMRPKRSTTASTSASMLARFVTSTWRKTGGFGRSETLSITAFAASSLMSAMTTVAPACM